MWQPWREEARGGAGLPGKWDLSLQQQQKVSSLGWQEGHPPSALPPAPRHIFWAPRGWLPLLHPPPRPCPAFPVNTDTSSPGRAWQCLGHTRLACHTMPGPLHTPGPPWDPEKCHPLLRAGQSNAAMTKVGKVRFGQGEKSASGCTASLQQNAGSHLTNLYTPTPSTLPATG